MNSELRSSLLDQNRVTEIDDDDDDDVAVAVAAFAAADNDDDGDDANDAQPPNGCIKYCYFSSL